MGDVKNLLVTTAGGSGVYPTIECVKNSKYKINLILADASELAPALYEGFKSYKMPLVSKNEYMCVLEEIIKRENIEYIMTPLDEELNFLADKDLKVKHLIPKKEPLLDCWDKRRTFNKLKDLMPKGYILSSELNLKEVFEKLYPLLLKPALSRGGRGIIIPEDFEEFEFYAKRFIKKSIPYLVQKLIKGKEYNITTLHDKKGNLIYAIPRWKFEKRVVKSGSKASVIVENERVVDFALNVLKRLDLEYGFNNVEVIENDEGIFLLEVNAGRIAAQDMNIVKAGVNYVDLFIDIVDDKDVIFPKYKLGICNLKSLRDIWVDFSEIKKKERVYEEIFNSCRTS